MTFHPPGCLCPEIKYRVWYAAICDRARSRAIPSTYTEVHHVKPRSLGGSDDQVNLVRLTYREHLICHMLLVRMTTGPDQRKMKKALGAMGLKGSGERIAAGWQVELAKRAVRDLELDGEAQAAWYSNRRQKRNTEKLDQIEEAKRDEAEYWAEVIRIFQNSPDQLKQIRSQKSKRDADLEQHGWHDLPSGPLKARFKSV